MQRDAYRLEDRHRATEGRVLLTGIQALARLPLDQLRLDRADQLNTAALISGYPGSPLGGLDLEVTRARNAVPELPIIHQPAVNEELAASAIMGSQLASGRADARYDGVVGIWYGKAPGLDRATDALRHGVFAGAATNGGAVVLVGDDPVAKSSTMPSSSDAALVDLHMPILYPGNPAECLELGLHAVAMSRASGLWSALKVITPVADGSGTVELPALTVRPVRPEIEVDGRPWRSIPSAVFLGPRMVEVEREFRQIRLELAHRYGVENRLNRATVDPDDAWIGLVATGFTYYETLEALRRLGLDDLDAIARAGIRLLQLRMPVPFDQGLVRHFARGLDEVLVVEEKNPTLEWLIKDALYSAPDRPVVTGKTDPDGAPLLPAFGQLDADAMVSGLRSRLQPRLADRLRPLPSPTERRPLIPLTVNRTPFFCSGCPHNWGTKVPEGAVVGAGTGCHGMSLLMDPERVGETIGITAMGNEGAHWIGMAPFVDTPHLVQNLGDGTYFHSGQLAIQAAIGAGTNMTFKILFNDTVAMTGGQDPSFRMGVPELVRSLTAQGVRRILITTDDPEHYDTAGLPPSVEVWHRNRIVEGQRLLAAIDGVTVLVHHQPCAAELRRARKRGTAPRPTTRVVINHRICEGCGDCGDKSSCLSVQPFETDLGRKTRIDQASCNLDLSCLEGDCPAFMTVTVDGDGNAHGPIPRRRPPTAPPPTPLDPAAADRWTVRLTGIGGTGVVTVAQILGTAAMFDGWEVHGLDQTGLSQKAGPVVSDLVLTRSGAPASNVIGRGGTDTLLALDPLVAGSDAVIGALGPHTVVIGSSSEVPTGAMVTDPSRPAPPLEAVEARLGIDGEAAWVDALGVAEALVGEAATANVLVLGAALQRGSLPVSVEAVEQAIELNGVAVDANRAALTWGR
ncbi:MAG: indolepyruvate ferredoxin oxidoreductase family protein [Actinomycetota bacterium]